MSEWVEIRETCGAEAKPDVRSDNHNPCKQSVAIIPAAKAVSVDPVVMRRSGPKDALVFDAPGTFFQMAATSEQSCIQT